MGMGGNGNGNDAMGVGGSGNLKTHSRTPLTNMRRRIKQTHKINVTAYSSSTLIFTVVKLQVNVHTLDVA